MKTEKNNQPQNEDYNPTICDHKIKSGKYQGFSNYEFLSQSSGNGGADGTHKVSLSVCRYCGEVKIQGYRTINGRIHQFCEEFSLYYPDSVQAIVNNCNYMNTETDGYKPFIKEL